MEGLTEIKDELKFTKKMLCISSLKTSMKRILSQVLKLIEIIESDYIKVDSIKKLQLAEGDIVVLTIEENIPKRGYEELKKSLKKLMPNNRVIILDGGADISTISQEEMETNIVTDAGRELIEKNQ